MSHLHSLLQCRALTSVLQQNNTVCCPAHAKAICTPIPHLMTSDLCEPKDPIMR